MLEVKKTWSAKQLKAFLLATKDDRLAHLWRVLAMTGMRRGEACGLRWEDVDLEKGRLSVRRALIPHGDGVISSEPKTAKGRRQIALDPATVEAFKAQAEQQLADQENADVVWQDTRLRVHPRRRPGAAPAERLTGLRARRRRSQAAEDPPA